MKLTISANYVSIITGHNIYQKKRDFLINFWKKENKEDFNNFKELTKFVKKTDYDKINEISKKNNLNVNKELNACLNSKDINELNKKKEDILQKIDKLPEDQKKEIKDSILNVSNTRFGVKNETNVLKIYQEKSGKNIIKDDKYRTKQILENDKCVVYIGGKVDGIDIDSGDVIEIKNRMHKLFFNLRSYEMVQLMCYLHIFEAKNGFLIEALKQKDSTEVNIIPMKYNKDIMDDILDKINKFVLFYLEFIKNYEKKVKLLTCEDEIEFF